MGLNDTHFTNPDRRPSQSLEHHAHDVAFRQQLASAFRPSGPHNVQMETGHVLLPATGGNSGHGPYVVVHHPNDESDRSLYLPIGDDPHQWFPNLMKHLNDRDVMSHMRNQMNGGW